MNTLLTWLIVDQTPSIPLKQWAIQLGSAQALLQKSDPELRAQGASLQAIQILRKPNHQLIESALSWQQQSEQHHLLCWEDPLYPPLLKEIYQPPLILYIKGKVELLRKAQLAIVGTRNPSPMGLELAEEFSRALALAGLVITSGLALGIDAQSHKAAMAEERDTLAILGSGLDCIYPRRHHDLAEKIWENGALISEYTPFIRPLAHHFPQRNRLISGLSLGTLVIEACLKSGSLITARFANEQGREVFAIPGSPHHPQAAGCNRLIQQGAKLVTEPKDVLEELKLNSSFYQSTGSFTSQFKQLELDPSQEKLLECIGFEMSSLDQISTRSGFSLEVSLPLLLDLELKGYIKTGTGGYTRSSDFLKSSG